MSKMCSSFRYLPSQQSVICPLFPTSNTYNLSKVVGGLDGMYVEAA